MLATLKWSDAEPFTDFFARPEDRNALVAHLDLNTTSWISANATCSILYGERSKPPQLNPILPGHSSNHLIEHDVYGFLHHSATDVEELARNVEHKL